MNTQNSENFKTMTLFQSVTSASPITEPKQPEDYKKFKEWMKSEEYQKMTKKEKDERYNKFNSLQEIKDYLEAKWNVEKENKNALEWLIDYKYEYLKENNKHESIVIDRKIKQFSEFLGTQLTIFPALRLDINKYIAKKESQHIRK